MNAKQIICPKCKTAIEVDDEVYASLLSQVRNQEFEDAVNKREKEIRKTISAENEAETARKQTEHNAVIAEKDAALSNKDNEIALLRKEIEGLSTEKEVEFNKHLAIKDQEIAKLMEKIDTLLENQRMAVENAEAKKDKEIADLKASLQQGENRTKIAVLEERQRSRDALADKEREIADLHSKMEQQENTAAITLANTKEQYETQLKLKDEQVAQYRDFKMRLSTKAIGESLEVWCMHQFNRQRMVSYPNAYFDKDNEVVEGTKGDFIFRDYIVDENGRHEYISIMFEMKNEADTTATKHRNSDFFKKLDEDRRKKGCEFAVLVSMLEPENEFYDGITNVSYEYEKMYVVRPQYFLTIIAILSELARNTAGLKKELEIARNQSIDVTNFETRWLDFQEAFGNNVRLYRNQFDEAMKRIDDAIDMLQKIKDTFRRSDRNLRLANDKAQDMSIRKMTYKNPTMKALFEEARQRSQAAMIESSELHDAIDDGGMAAGLDDPGY